MSLAFQPTPSMPARGWHVAEKGSRSQRLDVHRWVWTMIGADALVTVLATLVAHSIRFGLEPAPLGGLPYLLVVVLLPPVWVAVLAFAGSYDPRILSSGAEMFLHVYRAALTAVGGGAVLAFILHAGLPRGFVAAVVPGIFFGTVAVRYVTRKALQRRLREGAVVHRMLVLGSHHEVQSLVHHVGRAGYAGYSVVAGCVLGHHTGLTDSVHPELQDLDAVVKRLDVDTIAVAGVSTLGPGELRRLAWSLEGQNIALIVAPSVTDFAGPRIVIRPVDGLPLLHIDEPELTGLRRQAKHGAEKVIALAMLTILSPLLVLIALRIKLDDGGPIIYRQRRVGFQGSEFDMLKFRTMATDADSKADTGYLDEFPGVPTKIRRDPRVTRAGGFLRLHSLDELPQLWNVIRGEMSLVGPRPLPLHEARTLGADERRRQLVRAGMTGLWQISGRSDLAWEERIRLDLHYVENWSIAMDLLVIWKTLAVVLSGKGAY